MKTDPPKKPTPKPTAALRKVFDVSRPGKTPAAPTSRPVIVGHKHVDSNLAMSGVGESQKIMDSKHRITVQPHKTDDDTHETPPVVTKEAPEKPDHQPDLPAAPSAPPVPDAAKQKPEAEVPPVAAAPEAPKQPDAPAPPAPSAQPKADTPAALGITGVGRTAVDLSMANPPAPDLTPDEDAAAMNIPDTFNPKDIVVSQHRGHSTLVKEILAVLLILILVAVIVNILVDADIVDLDIPHTDFF